MTTDEWVTAALTDDAVVVKLLFRLKQSSEPFALQQAKPPPLVPPQGWGHRQTRSKPATAPSGKESESMRCSPTTPLSWSYGAGAGDASPSDGCDESSRPSDRSSGSRSKDTFTIKATDTTASINKQFRRKKTFGELKEEESLLLKEKIHLNKELATLVVTLEEQKVRSENLKRLKLDLHLQSAKTMADASTLDHVSVSSTIKMHNDLQAPNFCEVGKEVESRKDASFY
ncbi:hypothetical protein U1Q18_044053 [Sarracenia purpurea var. burkii]